jgi:hypothetical protein
MEKGSRRTDNDGRDHDHAGGHSDADAGVGAVLGPVGGPVLEALALASREVVVALELAHTDPAELI